MSPINCNGALEYGYYIATFLAFISVITYAVITINQYQKNETRHSLLAIIFGGFFLFLPEYGLPEKEKSAKIKFQLSFLIFVILWFGSQWLGVCK